MDRRGFIGLLVVGCGDVDVNRNRAPIGRLNRRGIGTGNVASGPFTPASLANRVLSLDSTQQAFSDTGGTTPVSAPSGRVRRIDQPAPLTGSWLASAANTSPFAEASPQCIDVAYGTNLAQPVGPTMNAQDCTYSIALTVRDYTQGQAVIVGTDGVTNFGIRFFGGAVLIYRQSGNWATGLSIPNNTTTQNPLTRVVLTVRHTATGSNYKATINGVTTTGSEVIAIASRTVSGLTFGPTNGFGVSAQAHVLVSRFEGIARAVTDAERDNLHTFMVGLTPPTIFTTAATLIVADGDSIPRGFAIQPSLAWPSLMPPNLWATAPVRIVSVPISGYTLEQMAADYATRVKPFIQAGRGKTFVIVAGSTNSIAFNSDTAAQVIALYFAYCDQITADGGIPIGQTVLPRTDAGIRGTYEADRLTVNAAYLASGTTHVAAWSDVASIAGMSTQADTTAGVNYQADFVHPTAAGHVKIEAVHRATMLSLLP